MNRFCPACGAPAPAAASICGRCAHPIDQPAGGSPQQDAGQAAPKPQPEWLKRLGPFGAVIAAALKFKTGIFLLLGKIGSIKTLLSMLAFFGVYWSLYGWKFAAGFVIGIYIHEMGHVWMLRQYGMRASMPMFIPGFGAFVSLYESPLNVAQDARIGLAGPLWGAGAAITAALMTIQYPNSAWVAIARTTAFINLFNLIPVWSLDGGRGFRALDQRQRLYWMGLAALLLYVTGEWLFAVLLIGAAYRVFWKKDGAPQPDQGAFLEFGGLLTVYGVLLAWLPNLNRI